MTQQTSSFSADEPNIDGGDLAILHATATGEGLIEITGADMFRELANAAQATKSAFDDDFAGMTQEQAEFVRSLRCGEDMYTWRAVASTCALEWGGDWGGNQIAGMAICEKAASFFGENYMEEPWN